MSNIREWNMWLWPVFKGPNDFRDKIDYWFSSGIGSIFAPLPSVGIGALLGLAIPLALADVLGFILVYALVWGRPVFRRIHVLHGIDEGSTYRENPAMQSLKKYLKLSPEDRAEFPSDIIAMFKDPDLTDAQSTRLIYAMDGIFNELRRRDAARAKLVARNVDIESAIAHMEYAKADIKEIAKTYQELQW